MTGRAGLKGTIPGGAIDTAQTVVGNRNAQAAPRNEARGRRGPADQTIPTVPRETVIAPVALRSVARAQLGRALSVEKDPHQSRNLFFPTLTRISSQKCWTGWPDESSLLWIKTKPNSLPPTS